MVSSALSWPRPARVRRNRMLLAVLLAALLLAPIVVTLVERVRNSVDAPMSLYVPGKQWFPVEIKGVPYVGLNGTYQVHRMRLALAEPTNLLRHDEVRIAFATYETTPHLRSAKLRVAGTTCVYETLPGARLINNTTLGFLRKGGCTRLQQTPTGEFDVEVIVEGARGRVAIWTFTPIAGLDEGDRLYVADPPWTPMKLQVQGAYVVHLPGSRLRRIDLLAYVWQIGSSPLWIWALLLLVAATLVLGLVLFPFDAVTRADDRRTIGTTSIAILLITASIGVLYAVVVPPFQAPDEPNHFLGYAQLAERSDIAAEADRWARVTHGERLRFDPSQRFRPSDVGAPLGVSWSFSSPTALETRSGLTIIWRVLARILRGASAEFSFLALRLLPVLLVAIAASVGLAVTMTSDSDAAFPQLSAFALLLVPMLPFFSMHVSNHAFLLAGYVLIAYAALVLFLDGRRSHRAGLLFGAGIFIVCSTSRSAVPILIFIGAMSAGRLVLGTRESSAPGRDAAVFWIGLAGGLALFQWLSPPSYLDEFRQSATQLPTPIEWGRRFLVSPIAAVIAAIAGAILEAGAARLRRPRSRRLHATGVWTVRVASVAAILAIVGSFAGSLFWTYPRLQRVVLHEKPPISVYVEQVVSSAATIFRLRLHDALVSTSFWASFGWLERLPPEWFITALVVATGLSAVVLCGYLARGSDLRRALWLAIAVVAFFGTLGVYAAVILVYSPDLHGRYLVGLYLALLMIVLSPLAILPEWRRARVSRVVPLMAIAMASHAFSLWFILTAYF